MSVCLLLVISWHVFLSRLALSHFSTFSFHSDNLTLSESSQFHLNIWHYELQQGQQRVAPQNCRTLCKILMFCLQKHTKNSGDATKLQWHSEMLAPLDVFPLNPIVNKSCNIECCGDKMLQTVTSMIVSLKLQI